MAKAMGKTLLSINTTELLSLNEVGSEPTAWRFSIDGFHKSQPRGPRHALAPSRLAVHRPSHDNKRSGRRARAASACYPKYPIQWKLVLGRWRKLNPDAIAANWMGGA